MFTNYLNILCKQLHNIFLNYLHMPAIPSFIYEGLEIIFAYMGLGVKWVSWLFPQPIWNILIEFLLAYLTFKFSIMVYRLALKFSDMLRNFL